MAKGKKSQLSSKMRTNATQLRESKTEKMSKNPFEIRKNKRLHHDITGRNVKGRTRNLVVAKNKALTQRQNDLENQFSHDNKKNIFQDRRFGENNSEMSADERMIKRLQAERKKQMKKNRFALADNEDDVLTHEGEELNFERQWKLAMKDTGNEEDDEDSEIDMETEMNKYYSQIKESDTNNNDDNNENKQKTHKEIMMEIINKSKEYKAERQREKAKIEDTVDKLDEDMDVLQGLLTFRNKADNKALPAGDYNDFDKIARELQGELKGKATERKKTEEEVMKEEHDKLAKLEEERIKRMKGAYVDSNNNIIEGGDELGENFKLDADTNASDDEASLASDVSEEEEEEDDDDNNENMNILNGDSMYGDIDMNNKKEEDDENEEEEEDDDDDDEEEEEEEEDENEDDDNDMQGTELSESNILSILKEKKRQETIQKLKEAKQNQTELRLKELEEKKKRKENMKKAEQEMPFIIPIPENVTSLMDLLYTYKGQEQELVHRIRVSNNIFNDKENKGKLINFYQMLLRAYENYANSIMIPKEFLTEEDIHFMNNSNNSDEGTSYSITKEDTSIYIHGFIQIQNALEDMSNDKYIKEGIDRIWKQKIEEIRNIIQQCIQYKTGYPSISYIMDIYLSFSIFPVTDYNHVILTSLIHVLGQLLYSCPITDITSLFKALYCISISLEYMNTSHHYIPEVFSTLNTITQYCFLGESSPLPLFINSNCDWLHQSVQLDTNKKLISFVNNKLPFYFFNSLLSPSIELRNIIQLQILKTIQQSIPIYASFNVVIELFKPILDVLITIAKQNLVTIDTIDIINDYIEPVINEIINISNNRKQFTVYSKIMEATTYTPKHAENYQPGKSLHPNREFIELQQLQRQKKSEKKAVEREIRKDAIYIDKLKEKEQEEIEEQRERKLHEVMGWLEDQERTINQAVKKGLAKGGGAKLGNNLKK